MNARLEPLSIQLSLHTRLLANCFEGVDDKTARKRPDAGANSMAFLGVHLVEARRFLATALGLDEPPSFGGRFGSATGIGDVDEDDLPAVGEIVAAWQALGAKLAFRLGEMTDEDLAVEVKAPFPVDDGTRLGASAFLMHHEAYHIGQLGYLRKLTGNDSMKYS